MDVTASLRGAHSAVSPLGQYIATVHDNKVQTRLVNAPERYSEISVRPATRDVTALKWSEDDRHIAIQSPSNIEIVNLGELDYRICLENGSGGLGRFTSATFVAEDQLLVTWEFGKARIWTLSNGKVLDIPDVKTTCNGFNLDVRPVLHTTNRQQTLATLSRSGAEDTLHIHFPELQKSMPPVRICTIDSQSVQWSPDGRWLAILDTPTVTPNLHIYTPDGHHFRSFPTTSETHDFALGGKSAIWSPDSQTLALTTYDDSVTLLNTRTFTPRAVLEHTTTVHQRSMPSQQRTVIWQESVSGSRTRSFILPTQPFSPPLSRIKPSLEPSELGVAEARFSCDGAFLATRDERMLSTVWLWNTASLSTDVILVQYNNVRRMQWHPYRPEMLLLDCGEGIAYSFNVARPEPPLPITITRMGVPLLSWVPTTAESPAAILARTKDSYQLAYLEGRPYNTHENVVPDQSEALDEGPTEDSLFDVLSSRKPLPPKTEISYTQRVDLDVQADEEGSMIGVDDTFHDKRVARSMLQRDALDDSEIF